MAIITVHELVNLLLSIVILFFCHGIIIHVLRTSFIGPLRVTTNWSFFKGFSRRVFGYVAVSLFFAYFGVGASLLPNPHFQATVIDSADDPIHPLPYSGEKIPGLEILTLKATMSTCLIGSMIISCCLRIVVARHSENLIWTVTFAAIVLSGFALFTYLQNPMFYRVLFDRIVRLEFPNSIWMVTVGCGLAALITEILIDKMPSQSGG